MSLSMPIHRTDTNADFPRALDPVEGHRPAWEPAVDCEHTNVLICTGCPDVYPCPTVEAVCAELYKQATLTAHAGHMGAATMLYARRRALLAVAG